MEINNLIVEVTRQCNIKCLHCLRGPAENLKMDPKYIDILLSKVSYISSVTFSGGEPSLNVPIIEYFLNRLMEKNVRLGSFYIATNGIKINLDFVVICLKLYSYSEEKDFCSVDVSNDVYHAKEGKYDTVLLDGLKFTNRKYSRESWNFDNGKLLIMEGKAKKLATHNHKQTVSVIENQEDFNDANIYLNCEGNIVNGCDWSYKSQKKNVLCSVDDLETYYNNLPDS